MGFILQILLNTTNRFEGMIASVYGVVATCTIATFNFFAGYKIALAVVLAAIIFDGIWGVCAARKQGRFFLSELGKETLKKIGAYGTALVMVMLIENLAFGSHEIMNNEGAHSRFIVDIVATIIAAVEFWSICGNILIVYPNAVFFRLLKLPLIGEIARKLKVSEDEVKRIFDEQNNANQ